MSRAEALWRGWTTPTTEGDLARRRERVLLATLAGAIVLSLVTQALQWAGFVLREVRSGDASIAAGVLWWLLNVAVGLGFYGMLRLAHAGRHRLSAGLLVGCFAALSVTLCLIDGPQAPMGPMTMVVALLLAAILLGVRAAGIVVLVGGPALIVLNALESMGDAIPLVPSDVDHVPLTDGLALALVLAYLAAVFRIYAREGVASIDAVVSASPERSPLRALRTKELSVREVEVVQLVASGLSNDAIAQRLFLSPRTVHSHVANAMRKCACANRTALGVLAVREGLVPLEEDEPQPAGS